MPNFKTFSVKESAQILASENLILTTNQTRTGSVKVKFIAPKVIKDCLLCAEQIANGLTVEELKTRYNITVAKNKIGTIDDPCILSKKNDEIFGVSRKKNQQLIKQHGFNKAELLDKSPSDFNIVPGSVLILGETQTDNIKPFPYHAAVVLAVDDNRIIIAEVCADEDIKDQDIADGTAKSIFAEIEEFNSIDQLFDETENSFSKKQSIKLCVLEPISKPKSISAIDLYNNQEELKKENKKRKEPPTPTYQSRTTRQRQVSPNRRLLELS